MKNTRELESKTDVPSFYSPYHLKVDVKNSELTIKYTTDFFKDPHWLEDFNDNMVKVFEHMRQGLKLES